VTGIERNSLRTETLEKFKRLFLIIPLFAFHIISYNFLGMYNDNCNYSFLLRLDYIIPFVPEMVWVYMTTYIVIPLVGFIIKEERDLYRLVIAIFLTWFFTYPVFYFFPAIYPRPDFEITGLSTKVLQINYLHDVPNNTFPSLHVSLSFVVAFAMIHINKRNKFFWLTWGLLISLSTVMVKKHFILDSLGGLIIAQVSYLLTFKLKIADNMIKILENYFKKSRKKKHVFR